LFESFLLLGSGVMVVRLPKPRRWDLADGLEQTAVGQSVDLFPRGELDLLELPGPFVADDPGLVETDEVPGEVVVMRAVFAGFALPLGKRLGQVDEFERDNLSHSPSAVRPPAGRSTVCQKA